jgi:hypothetical protein
VKLTDFGLARAADDASITQSGMVAGTPLYMSPEQARGEPLDPRSDLFSLGSVLYAMITGRPPFRAANTLAVMKRVTEDTPRPIPDVIPEAPPWLCDLIARLHAKDREARFQSAQEVADQLSRYLTKGPPIAPALALPAGAPEAGRGQPSTVTLPAPREKSRRRPQRRYAWAAAAAGLLLLAGLGLTEATGVTGLRGTVVRLFTAQGTLVVASDDPDVRIAIDGEEVSITGAGVQELRVKPGRYTVQARKDGQLVREELVTVTRNGKEVVRISRESPAAVKGQPAAWHALYFDGMVSHVEIPTLKRAAGREPITLEAWVRPAAAGGHDAVVVVGGGGRCQLGRNGRRWEAIDWTGGWLGYGPPVAKQWVHLAYCSDGQVVRFLVGGRIVAAQPIGRFEYADTTEAVHHTWIAAHSMETQATPDYHFKGTIREVRVSSTARYTMDFTPPLRHEPDKDTLALYHFDDGTGHKLTDSSGHGHHGTIVGATWVKVDPFP